MTRKNSLIIILSLFVTIFSLFTAGAQTKKDIKHIPDLELNLNNNETVKLSEFKGKVVLLDFWYRSCKYCVKSIPGLIELQEEFKDDLVIIGINHFDAQEDVNEYIDYKKMNYLSTYKTGEKIFEDFSVDLFPTVILYDREGKLIKIEKGYHEGGVDSLRKAIKKALK
ncbi:TlpA family protein disulfide reductase [Flavobacterium alkalisoli]|uniref:TlpA family protein disulfide reductase n=1 Tax=Flavobacterium alkalisoli TaxID=2602769 RepID=A0A5B9FUC1_9FLAO|nr:TlpA disulfide reductase family protein [Flavobacterium alkalisoli]QEE48317.1 TlpA family protein disulfide reductase [Flavobacterium alkalisoli]